MYQVEYTDERNHRFTIITPSSLDALKIQRDAQKKGYVANRYVLKEKDATVVIEKRLCK